MTSLQLHKCKLNTRSLLSAPPSRTLKSFYFKFRLEMYSTGFNEKKTKNGLFTILDIKKYNLSWYYLAGINIAFK